MGGVDLVDRFHLGREFLLSFRVWLSGLLVIVAMQPLFLVLSIQVVGLFKHPTFPVCVVGWFVGGAVNLTRAIEYAVQTGRAWIVSFERLFLLTKLRATESGIDCRVFGVIAIVAMLVSVVSGLAVATSGI